MNARETVETTFLNTDNFVNTGERPGASHPASSTGIAHRANNLKDPFDGILSSTPGRGKLLVLYKHPGSQMTM